MSVVAFWKFQTKSLLQSTGVDYSHSIVHAKKISYNSWLFLVDLLFEMLFISFTWAKVSDSTTLVQWKRQVTYQGWINWYRISSKHGWENKKNSISFGLNKKFS